MQNGKDTLEVEKNIIDTLETAGITSPAAGGTELTERMARILIKVYRKKGLINEETYNKIMKGGRK